MSSMTTTRMSTSRRTRLGRRAAVAVLASGGIALTPLPASAHSTAETTAASAPVSVSAPTTAAQVAVDTALAQVGDPYGWGNEGPDSFDCSGLMQYAYAAAGISLPRTSSIQATVGTPVSYDALQPGDLVYFYSPVSHIAMYIGNGQIVQASTYGKPVHVTQLAYMPEFAGARRVV